METPKAAGRAWMPLPVLLCTVFLYCAVTMAEGPNYGEPIVLPGTETAADPAVIRVDDVYYLYPTSDVTCIECWSSTDLETWAYEGIAWGPGQPGAWNDSYACAPDVLPYEGKFYMYYCAGRVVGHVGVAVADEPVGPFVDVYDHPFIGGGYGGTLIYAIDPHVIVDDDGSLYMYCTNLSPFSSVRVALMVDPVTLIPDWTVLLRPGVVNWEWILCEGSWMARHNGLYYLMYSGNGATVPEYAIGYATSDNPLGPFTKHPGNPILDADWDHDFWGPGHNSVVEDDQGTMWMFYHTKFYPEEGWDRFLRKNEIAFTDSGELYVVLDDDDDDTDDDSDDDTDDDADDDSGDDDSDDDADDDEESGDDDDDGECGC